MYKQPKAVSIIRIENQAGLSRSQKQFNTLNKKIEQAKNTLSVWQNAVLEYNHLVITEYEPVRQRYNDSRVELLQLFDRAWGLKSHPKNEKKKLSHLICDLAYELIDAFDRADLKSLYDKHSQISFDELREREDALHHEMMRRVGEDLFGLDPAENVDFSSPEAVAAAMEDVLRREAEAEQQRRAKRKKSAKQLQAEARKLQEEQDISLTIREIFRKLTSAVHPDREPDEDERLRKTELMQRVNAAYQKKDLLALLGLQLEIEQIDASHINTMAEEKLKYVNKVLREQLSSLEQEIESITEPFRIRLGWPHYAAFSPASLFVRLRAEIGELRGAAKDIQSNLDAFRDDGVLSLWLKHYKIPK